MRRQVSSLWWVLLWIPVFALVLGLVVGCAAESGAAELAPVQPSHAELREMVAQELAANSRFDSFGASHSADARQVAALFTPVLADASAVDCRAAPGQTLDCTLEVVLQFPAMGGRESRTYWERRLRREPGGWRLVGEAQP
jgi:hypothetical protein